MLYRDQISSGRALRVRLRGRHWLPAACRCDTRSASSSSCRCRNGIATIQRPQAVEIELIDNAFKHGLKLPRRLGHDGDDVVSHRGHVVAQQVLELRHGLRRGLRPMLGLRRTL